MFGIWSVHKRHLTLGISTIVTHIHIFITLAHFRPNRPAIQLASKQANQCVKRKKLKQCLEAQQRDKKWPKESLQEGEWERGRKTNTNKTRSNFFNRFRVLCSFCSRSSIAIDIAKTERVFYSKIIIKSVIFCVHTSFCCIRHRDNLHTRSLYTLCGVYVPFGRPGYPPGRKRQKYTKDRVTDNHIYNKRHRECE